VSIQDDIAARQALIALENRDPARARAAFDTLLRRHKPRIYRLCLGVTGDADLAASLTRAVVRVAWQRLPRLDLDQTHAWSWIAGLAREIALERVRARGDPLLEDGVLFRRAPAAATLQRLSRQEPHPGRSRARGPPGSHPGATWSRARSSADPRGTSPASVTSVPVHHTQIQPSLAGWCAMDDHDSDSLLRTREAIERGTLDPALKAEFEQTIRAHSGRIFRTCLRVVRNEQRAEELTQEALIVALSKLGSFSGRSTLSTWLCGIAKHLALNEVRKKGELLSEDGILEDREDVDALSALRQLSRLEREQVITDSASASLDPQEQEIVYLRYVENLPYDTIESLLALEPDNRPRGALQRIKRKMKKDLQRRLEDLGHGLSFIRTTHV
jgi:RNA polymerase sigma-70 factor, ECF subfamily